MEGHSMMTTTDLEKGVAALAACNRRGELSDLGLIDAVMILVDQYAAKVTADAGD